MRVAHALEDCLVAAQHGMIQSSLIILTSFCGPSTCSARPPSSPRINWTPGKPTTKRRLPAWKERAAILSGDSPLVVASAPVTPAPVVEQPVSKPEPAGRRPQRLSMMNCSAPSGSQTAILSEGLLTVETPDSPRPLFELLMRRPLPSKGPPASSASAAVRVAHAMEDASSPPSTGKVEILPHHIDILLQAVDLLGQTALVAEDQLQAWETAHEEVIAAMETSWPRSSGKSTAPTPPQKASEGSRIPVAPSKRPPRPSFPGSAATPKAVVAPKSKLNLRPAWKNLPPRLRRSRRSGGPRHRGEPDSADGPGGRIVGPDALSSARSSRRS